MNKIDDLFNLENFGTEKSDNHKQNKQNNKKTDDFDVSSVNVTDEMKVFLSAVDDKYNIFLTGSAGSGKSTLIKYFMKTTNKKIALLAPTGIAGCLSLSNTERQTTRFKTAREVRVLMVVPPNPPPPGLNPRRISSIITSSGAYPSMIS
jgi:DNA replication protein DnaC